MRRKSTTIIIALGVAAITGVGYLMAFSGSGSSPGAGSSAASLTQGLVGYWSLDEGNGQTANDSSGNGNNGTLTNGPKWTTGKNIGALDFDGTNDYVDLGSGSSLDITSTLTLSAWIKPDVVSGDRHIVAKASSNNVSNRAYFIRAQNANAQFVIVQGGTANAIAQTSAFTAGQWTHIVGTYDGVTQRIYIDGVEKNSTARTGAIDSETGKAYIGTIFPTNALFDGQIDEVRIYNRALSASEIRFLYNRGGPVAHWTFDEGSGTTAFDSSGSNDGILTNMTDADWVQGKYGTALDFDGSDDAVTVTNADLIDFDVGLKNAVTFSAWINADTDGENNVGEIIDKGVSTYIRVDTESAGSLDVEASLDLGTASATLNVSAALSTNTWHHVVMTYEDDTDDEITLYVDGKNIGSSTNGDGSPAADANNLLIGGDTNANFDGTIDDVRIYNYARTAEEILVDYNAGLSTYFR